MLKTRHEIDGWLIKYGVTNYIINEDLTVNVHNSVDLSNKRISNILVQFNVIKGSFYCSQNNLTSLEGCPKEVNGSFSCENNQLSSLEYSPKTVEGDYFCNYNKLTTLNGCPINIPGCFACHGNRLNSLEHSPMYVGRYFNFQDNKVDSIEYGPNTVKGNIYAFGNKLEDFTKDMNQDEFKIHYDNYMLQKRLNNKSSNNNYVKKVKL